MNLDTWTDISETADNPRRMSLEWRGWRHEETEEAVGWHRANPDKSEFVEDRPIDVFAYLDVSEGGLAVNGSRLFRARTPSAARQRLRPYLVDADTPTTIDRFTTIIDVDAVRRAEIEHVATLRDWAHKYGAAYYQTEKIGHRKRSSGEVAHFGGSTRRGDGAYVAIASENGPSGQRFASIGGKPAGYYTVDSTASNRDGVELSRPTVQFDDNTITITSSSGPTVTVTATTDAPSEPLHDPFNE